MQAEINVPSIKKNFLLSTAWQILQLISPFITAPYISRILQPEGIGIYSYTRSIQMYFSLFALLGTNAYGTREISRNRDDPELRSKTFWEIEGLSVFSSCVVILAWFSFILFGAKDHKIIFIILTMNLLSSMFDISWLYAGLEQFKYIVAKNSFFQILSIILQFILIRSKDDLYIYVIIMAGTALFGNISMWITLKKFVSRPKLKELKIFRHLKDTLVYFIPAIATSMYTLLDKVLIGALTKNPDENGFYEQASQVINMGKVITFASINQVVGARISYLHKEQKFDEIRARIDTSCRYILCIGCAVSFGIAAVSDTFIPWFFGVKFTGAVMILKLLCPLIVIIGISNLLGSQWYTPAGLRGKSAVFIIIGAITNVILTILLIPRFNAIGAVIGTFSAELVITILYLVFCNKNLTFIQIIRNGWRNILAGIIMFVTVNYLNGLGINEILRLPIQVCSGVIIYGIILIILKDTFVTNLIHKGLSFVKKEKSNE